VQGSALPERLRPVPQAVPGGTFVAGDCAAAAGFIGACTAGLVAGAVAGDRASGGSARAKRAQTRVSAEMVSSVFIIEAGVLCDRLSFGTGFPLSQTTQPSRAKLFIFFRRRFH
jgi:hypothetical protein